MYKVLIEDQEIEISQEELDNFNLTFNQKNGVFHALSNGQSHQIVPMESSENGKIQTVSVDNIIIETTVLNTLDQQVKSMGLSIVDESKSRNIIAPMPGLILEIMCSEGDEIEEGTSLLILEAMKMENVIKAEGSGTITKIHNSKGDSVDKGQLIIEID